MILGNNIPLQCRMSNGEDGQIQSKDKIIQIFSDFMTRIAKFEELTSVGSRLLVGFQQALGFLGQPSTSKTSALVERIIKTHGSKRVLSYEEAGCVNHYDCQQNTSNCLLDDAASAVQTANKNDEDVNDDLNSFVDSDHKEKIPLSDHSKPGVAEYAARMTIIYSMVKQDYTMQVRIVSSLGYKTSSGELETYCQMWSLRPFVDDDIMHEAWSLVP